MQIGDKVRVTSAGDWEYIWRVQTNVGLTGLIGELVCIDPSMGKCKYKVKFDPEECEKILNSQCHTWWVEGVEPIETTEQKIQRLEQELKELKSSGWVRITNTNSAATAVVHSERRYGFGFDSGDTWVKELPDYSCDPKYTEEPVPQEVVEELLINEAKKRGIVAGAKIVTTWGENCMVSESEKFEYVESELYVATENLMVSIFSNGKWAKVVKRTSIEFGDHTAEIVDDCVKVGCYILSRDFITKLAKLTGVIEVKYKGENINKKIKKLADRFGKK